jgi:hypothetical protein
MRHGGVLRQDEFVSRASLSPMGKAVNWSDVPYLRLLTNIPSSYSELRRHNRSSYQPARAI